MCEETEEWLMGCRERKEEEEIDIMGNRFWGACVRE